MEEALAWQAMQSAAKASVEEALQKTKEREANVHVEEQQEFVTGEVTWPPCSSVLLLGLWEVVVRNLNPCCVVGGGRSSCLCSAALDASLNLMSYDPPTPGVPLAVHWDNGWNGGSLCFFGTPIFLSVRYVANKKHQPLWEPLKDACFFDAHSYCKAAKRPGIVHVEHIDQPQYAT